jgi:membrane associated rhomboid family serine protease
MPWRRCAEIPATSKRGLEDFGTLSIVEREIDYTKYTEPELVEMFGRMDPRFAPEECERLAKFLRERDYIVTEGGTGPGFAVPSPGQLKILIGSSRPIECDVDFGKAAGPPGWMGPTHNDFGFAGPGTLQTDGLSVYLSGQVGAQKGLFPSPSQQQVQLPLRKIVNVESRDGLIRFEYGGGEFEDGAITLRLRDASIAERLIAALPKERTKAFRSQINANAEFRRRLVDKSTRTPVTVALIAINALVFVATLMGGAELFKPIGGVQIAWGSNFGPYTTDGEWWRLFTSLFIHFGILHIVLNMLALAIFGPLVERLYGSVTYLLIYLFAGMAGGLASVSWHPGINSAGASGAIFGILGALLAAPLRAGDTFPTDIVRSIRHWFVVFLGWSLYAGFKYKGIDYAAHLGGLVSGFIIGLVAARPITAGTALVRSDLLRLSQTVAVAAVLLSGGFWFAQRASASLVGEGLYWHTVHWLAAGERSTSNHFKSAVTMARANKQSSSVIVEPLEKEVLPFWRQAGDRLAAIELRTDSPCRSNLDLLQEMSDGRADAYELLDEGLRNNDRQKVETAEHKLSQIENLATQRSGSGQGKCLKLGREL